MWALGAAVLVGRGHHALEQGLQGVLLVLRQRAGHRGSMNMNNLYIETATELVSVFTLLNDAVALSLIHISIVLALPQRRVHSI